MQNYSFDFIGIGFYCNYIICNIKTISGILDVDTRYFYFIVNASNKAESK